MKVRLRGIIWGTAIGLFLDSLILVTTTAWLLFAIWPLLIPITVGAIVGALLYHGTPITVSPHAAIVRFFAIIFLWFTCIAVPIIARWVQLRMEAQTLPICAECQIEKLDITVLAFDNTPGYGMVLQCNCDPSECIEFYRRELPKLGWSKPVTHRSGNHISYEFTRPRRRLRISDMSKEDYIAGTSTRPILILWTKRQKSIFLVSEKFFSSKEVPHAAKTIYRNAQSCRA